MFTRFRRPPRRARLGLSLATALAAAFLGGLRPDYAFAAFNFGFTGVGDLPGGTFQSTALGLNPDGSVAVGGSISGPGQSSAFRWTRSGGIASLGPDMRFANATNADGSVIAGDGAVGFGSRAARWTPGGGVQLLEPLPDGAVRSVAYAISGDGSVIVGMRDDTDGDDGMETFPGSQAFRWTGALGLQLLGDLPGGRVESFAYGVSADGNVIVGYGNDGTNKAFRWTAAGGMQSLGLLGAAGESRANGISADGSTIIGRSTSPGGTEAFRWTSGGMVGLGDLPGGPFFSEARAASGNGSAVVGYGYTVDALGNNIEQAFLWTPGQGMRHLKTVLQTDFGLNLSGWDLFDAKSISADGTTIAGVGRNPAGNFEGWIATIPEPASLALVAAAAPAVLRRRRPR